MSNLARTFAREAKDINSDYALLKNELHNVGQRAARIGETLCRVKDGLEHGQFEAWVEENLKFGLRQAQRYMQFHAQLPDRPDRELLAEQWRELTHPSKAHHGALLTAQESQAPIESEGGAEPEERETQVTEPQEDAPTEAPAPRGTEPPAETRLDADGRPIPTRLLGIFDKAADFERFAQALSTLKGQVRQAIEGNSVAWGRFSENAFRAGIDKLHDLLSLSGPHIVCPYCGGDQSTNCTACKGTGFLTKAQSRCVPKEMRP